jgi:hypothetical protein
MPGLRETSSGRGWGCDSWGGVLEGQALNSECLVKRGDYPCLERTFLLFLGLCWADPWHHSVLRPKEAAELDFTSVRMEAAGQTAQLLSPQRP